MRTQAPSGTRFASTRSPTKVRWSSARPRCQYRAEHPSGAIAGPNGWKPSPFKAAPKNEADELARKVTRLQRLLVNDRADTIMALVAAVDAKDPTTEQHSVHVSIYAEYIAKAMGLSPQEIRTIKNAAVLHDIGKIGTPDAVLTKPGPLTIAEYQLVKQHPLIGAAILQPVTFLQQELPLVLHHHEWYNGAGYPHGLSGEAIPLGARILHAADSIDAMASKRSYKRAYDLDKILLELRRGAGTQFDPRVAEVAIAWLKRHPEQVFSPTVGRKIQMPQWGVQGQFQPAGAC